MYQFDAHRELDEGRVHLLAPLVSRLELDPESLERTKGNGDEFYAWGRLEAMIADLIDEVRILRAVQTTPPKRKPKWDQYPRPQRQARPRTLDDAAKELMTLFGSAAN